MWFFSSVFNIIRNVQVMKENTKNMTEGKTLPILIKFALPLVAGNVFQLMYTFFDTAIVGKYLGVQALAALGAVEYLIWLLYGMIQGITQGFSIKMAQDFGAGDTKKPQKSCRQFNRAFSHNFNHPPCRGNLYIKTDSPAATYTAGNSSPFNTLHQHSFRRASGNLCIQPSGRTSAFPRKQQDSTSCSRRFFSHQHCP